MSKHCEGCRFNCDGCTKYTNTSWVDRRGGCNFNVPNTEYAGSKARVGQQKGGRKIVAAADLTQGGLFPVWDGIGIKWKTVNYKGKKLHSTQGRDKPFGKCTPLARFLAKKSRGYKHKLYSTQCEKWRKIQ